MTKHEKVMRREFRALGYDSIEVIRDDVRGVTLAAVAKMSTRRLDGRFLRGICQVNNASDDAAVRSEIRCTDYKYRRELEMVQPYEAFIGPRPCVSRHAYEPS